MRIRFSQLLYNKSNINRTVLMPRNRLYSTVNTINTNNAKLTVPTPTTTTAPIIFILGGPGSGKGTQSTLLTLEYPADIIGITDTNIESIPKKSLIAVKSLIQTNTDNSKINKRRFGCIHISMGALLRNTINKANTNNNSNTATSALSIELQSYLNAGNIVPGSITAQLLLLSINQLIQSQYKLNPLIQPIILIDGFPRTMENIIQYKLATANNNQNNNYATNLLYIDCTDELMLNRLLNRSISARTDDRTDIINHRLSVFHSETMKVIQWWDSDSDSDADLDNNNSPNKRLLLTIDGKPSIETVYKSTRFAFELFMERYKYLLL